MFQPEWARKDIWLTKKHYRQVSKSKLDRERVEKTLLLHWEEHCSECAPPECYNKCPLYLERLDKKCANFLYGIYHNTDFLGLFDFGADIQFRRWSKLEAKLHEKTLTPLQHRVRQNVNCAAAKIVNTVSDFMQPINPRRKANGAFSLCRSLLFNYLSDNELKKGYFFDEFVFEAYLPDGEPPAKLILEYGVDNQIRFRYSFTLSTGRNFYAIPSREFHFTSSPWQGTIKIYPEEGTEPRVIFTWLDFVRYKKSILQKEKSVLKPAPKVKCVAWDLDNTLWAGILAEDGRERLKPNEEVFKLINQLDQKGVLQTIVSKNDFDETWKVVEDFGLQDYFLYPAINWGQKSVNIEEIAKKLNINVDTFALIDDSPFERAEVQYVLPQVRIYSKEDITALITRPEFDVLITETGKTRRLSYLAELKRESMKQSFPSNYKDFLRSCEMKLDIFIPREGMNSVRCLELTQRSNQLNLSGRQYTRQEFEELLSDSNLLCLALACRDRFGDYGIVGFVSIDESIKIPMVRDFVISCRSAQKMVEHTFFKWLVLREAKNGKSLIQAGLIRSERNSVLFRMLQDISFQVVRDQGRGVLMELSVERATKIDDVMKVESAIRC